ncbi:MAG: hypothetical protein KDI28_01425 [Pseudomonadales bacterium]|nr:hypothetical protein [Pseudomonadales bacterium]MCP5357357.1 hypothetical protein [Pseudomonadales bacterium]
MKPIRCTLALAGIAMTLAAPAWPQAEPGLNMREIMLSIIAPMTNKIWAASDIQTDSQWLELEQAAMTVLAAGTLIGQGGPDGVYATQAKNEDWQAFTAEMMHAARSALSAIANHDEEALFNAGNDELYPPCENCHQAYLPR